LERDQGVLWSVALYEEDQLTSMAVDIEKLVDVEEAH
jgi:hypothetical protein